MKKNFAKIIRDIAREHSVFGKFLCRSVGRKTMEINSADGAGGFDIALCRKGSDYSRKAIAASAFGKSRISGGIEINISARFRNNGGRILQHNYCTEFFCGFRSDFYAFFNSFRNGNFAKSCHFSHVGSDYRDLFCLFKNFRFFGNAVYSVRIKHNCAIRIFENKFNDSGNIFSSSKSAPDKDRVNFFK